MKTLTYEPETMLNMSKVQKVLCKKLFPTFYDFRNHAQCRDHAQNWNFLIFVVKISKNRQI